MATLIKKGRKKGADNSVGAPMPEAAAPEPVAEAEPAPPAVHTPSTAVVDTRKPPQPPGPPVDTTPFISYPPSDYDGPVPANFPRSYGNATPYDVGAKYAPPGGADDFQLPNRYIPAEPPPSPEGPAPKGGLLQRVLLFSGEPSPRSATGSRPWSSSRPSPRSWSTCGCRTPTPPRPRTRRVSGGEPGRDHARPQRRLLRLRRRLRHRRPGLLPAPAPGLREDPPPVGQGEGEAERVPPPARRLQQAARHARLVALTTEEARPVAAPAGHVRRGGPGTQEARREPGLVAVRGLGRGQVDASARSRRRRAA